MKIRAIGRSFFLIAIVMIGLSGCGQQEKTATVIDENSPIEFSWYIAYDWFTPPNSWGADPVSGWIKENKKVDITWMNPSGASGDRLNLMIATGELPDVMCLERDGPRIGKLIESGMLLPLDPYLDELPNLKKWAGINLELLRHADGKLYQFPNWYIDPNATSGNGGSGWGINTKIYKALGSPSLATFEDLEAYLLKVKATYPDVIPLETGDGFQAGQLVFRGMAENLTNYMDNRLGTPKDNKYTRIFEDQNVRATVLLFNQLMSKKLMTQDAFTQTRDQVVEKLVNGKVAVFASYDFSNLVENANANNKISKDLYDVIWPPVKKGVDSSKVKLSGFATVGWNVNVFSKNSESKLRRILRYMDWATGEEGQRVLCYGPPGYFWDTIDENGVPVWNAKYEQASDKERTESRIFNWNWVGNVTLVDIGKVAANKRLPPDKQNPIVRMQGEVIWKTSWNENQFAYQKPDPASDLGIIDTQIADLYEEARAKAIFATNAAEASKILDEAQAEMNELGYDQFIEYHNQQWAKKREQLELLKSTRPADAKQS